MQDDLTTQTARMQGNAIFERNNFYFGQLMTARVFTNEQRYLNEKRWLLNRLGLGWGVLCGLKVRPHDYDAQKVIVEPGFAIDQYGHEILVCHNETIDLAAHRCEPEEESDRYKEPHFYYVSIKYKECGINPSPVPLDDCDGYKEICSYNHTRETYRFVVTREKPAFDLKCQADCHHFLKDPSSVISDCCPDRPKCESVPLARICYNPATETTSMDIDMGPHNRKLAFSNENLYELLSCLKNEVRQGRAAGTNRQQHVPLLASTIRGLTFQDGRNVRLDEEKGYEGKYPFRLTSDGNNIWITDRDDEQIWRIKRSTNEPIRDEKLYLPHKAWGIAFDGEYMWITHRDGTSQEGHPADGKLTRVNACTLERWTIDGLPLCENLPACFRFPDSKGAPDVAKLKPNTGEIVLHDGDIYVAHDSPKETETDQPQKGQSSARGKKQKYEPEKDQRYEPETVGYELSLTRIDPVKGCIIETIEIGDFEEREPRSRIRAMASDGDALWIAYQASSGDRMRKRLVVRKITKVDGESVVGDPHRLSGEMPEHMVFDGTSLWVSHNDGISIVDIESGEEEKLMCQRTKHAALAYGGGEMIWAATPGANEAFINWINIYSEDFGQWLELIDDVPREITGFEISNMQFDGTYIYVAYHLVENGIKKGVIYRLLP